MKTNDIKKGMRIRLTNGWRGTMFDNKRGNIRTAEVEGIHTEIGSIYAWDIDAVVVDGRWVPVELTPAQIKARNKVNTFYGERVSYAT